MIELHRGQLEVFSYNSRFKVVVAGRRWGKCSKIGTKIALHDGSYKNIENILKNDLVLTINEGTYELEPRKVKHLHDNGVKELLSVKTRSGRTLEITPNHPLLANNIWTESRHISVGDLIATPKRTTFGNVAMSSHEIDMLSIWLAEGDHNGYTNETPQIVEIMNIAAKSMRSEFVDADYGRKRKGLRWRWRGVERRNNGAIEMLRKYELRGKTSKTKFIPNEIFSLPKIQLARFLNLFVACDGSINRRSKNTWAMEIGLANEKMIHQLADLFLKFGIRGNISHKVHKAKSSVTGRNFESWRFIVSDSESLAIFCEEIGALSKEGAVSLALAAAKKSAGSSNSYLPIAYDDFIQHLEYAPEEKGKYGGHNAKVARDLPSELRIELNSWRKQTRSRISRRRYENVRKYSDGHFDPIADGEFAWDEVVSVNKVDEDRTYDLTVDGNHNFIANGMVTHNTELSKAAIINACTVQKRLIWYVAPTYGMARQIMWQQIIDAIPPRWIVKKNETIMQITLINKTIIQLKGADKPDTLRGVGLDYVVMDEFQDMKPETWSKVLRPTLATTGGHALFIGCVVGKTRILSSNGFRRIGDFSSGESDKSLVKINESLYGSNREFHNADGFWNNGIVKTKTIHTQSGFSIQSSLPHPLLTMGEKGIPVWKKTEDIEVGDRTAQARGMNVWAKKNPFEKCQEHIVEWRKGRRK